MRDATRPGRRLGMAAGPGHHRAEVGAEELLDASSGAAAPLEVGGHSASVVRGSHEAAAALRIESEMAAGTPLRALVSTDGGAARLESLAAVGEGLLVTDLDGRVLDANDRWCELVGLPRERVIDTFPPYPWWPEGHRAEYLERVRHPQTDGPEEIQLVRADGARFEVSMSVTPVSDANGTQLGWLRLARDVTVEEDIGRARHESEAQFRLLAENSTDILARQALDGTVLYVSPSARTVLGREPDDIVGSRPFDMLPAGEAERARAIFDRVVRTGVTYKVTESFPHEDGRKLWLEVHGRAVRDPDTGEVVEIHTATRDVTEEREAVLALRDNEQRFRALVQEAVDMVAVIGSDGEFSYLSPSIERIAGHDTGSLDMLTAFGVLHPSDRAAVAAAYASSLEQPGVAVPLTYRYRHGDGSWRRIEGTYTNLLHEPAVDGVVINARDVTERTHAQEALRASETRLRSVIDTRDEGIVVVARGARVLLVNTPAARILGIPLDELLGGRDLPAFRQILRDDGVPLPREEMPLSITFRTGRELSGVVVGFRNAHDDLRWVSVNTRVLTRSSAGRPESVVVSFSDITERRQVDLEVRGTEARFRALVENTTDVVSVVDPNGLIAFASPSAAALLHRSVDALLGAAILDLVHPDDRDAARHAFDAVTSHGLHAVSGAPTTIRLLHDGGGVRWVELIVTNLIDEPAVGGVLVTARDVTERRLLEDQLAQASKLEAIGRLAGGIAHDFNNLLTAISGYATLLLADLDDADSRRGELAEILRASDRAAVLVDQLLAFSRQRVVQPEAIDLDQVITGMDPLLRRVAATDIELRHEPADSPVTVFADRSQVEQILLNLIVNARDAMKAGGRVTLAVDSVDTAGDLPGLHPGSYGVLTVGDDGPGMDEQTAARVFEPFFTTKPPGQGTGLGLATVFGIATQAGGAVMLETAPGRGATFRVYLPAVSDRPGER